MAVKQANYSTVPENERTEPMQFRIEGLRVVADGVFEIEARPVHINFEVVQAMLMEDARIPKNEAIDYTERFYRMVQQGELARFLAERMERVG